MAWVRLLKKKRKEKERKRILEFLGSLVVKGSSIFIAVACGGGIPGVAPVSSLAWELVHVAGAAKKEKKKEKK